MNLEIEIGWRALAAVYIISHAVARIVRIVMEARTREIHDAVRGIAEKLTPATNERAKGGE